jgi:restriction system protein
MGAIYFDKGDFANHLHELIGYKAGIAVSINDMCDLLSDSPYPDEIMESEEYGIRIRSEDYEELYYNILHKVGVTDKPYTGIFGLMDLQQKFWESHGEQFVTDIFHIFISHMVVKDGCNSVDPSEMFSKAANKYGVEGLKFIYQMIEEYDRLISFNPHSKRRWQNWTDIIELSDLFKRFDKTGTEGIFFDQRFVDFLAVNQEKLGSIHWRKFEELIGECFIKFGYKVEIGAGSNDDGVDLRAWREDDNNLPELIIIQCKRQKEKINKVTVKGLYADVEYEKATKGLLVTSSEFSLGARKTVSARAYPIEEVNGEMIKQWLITLRTLNTGIVRF